MRSSVSVPNFHSVSSVISLIKKGVKIKQLLAAIRSLPSRDKLTEDERSKLRVHFDPLIEEIGGKIKTEDEFTLWFLMLSY